MTKLSRWKCFVSRPSLPNHLTNAKNRPIRPATSERFHHKPVISDELKNTTAKEGEIVTLVCRVTSELHPHFIWIKHYQVNGSWEDEEKKPYYRRIYPTQVSIRTTIATPCGMPPPASPLFLLFASPPFRELYKKILNEFHLLVFLESRISFPIEILGPIFYLFRRSSKRCSNPPLGVSWSLHPLTFPSNNNKKVEKNARRLLLQT